MINGFPGWKGGGKLVLFPTSTNILDEKKPTYRLEFWKYCVALSLLTALYITRNNNNLLCFLLLVQYHTRFIFFLQILFPFTRESFILFFFLLYMY